MRIPLCLTTVPRCNSAAAILKASSLGEALSLVVAAYCDALPALLLESRVSLAALGVMFSMSLAFARGGGIGVFRGTLYPLLRHASLFGRCCRGFVQWSCFAFWGCRYRLWPQPTCHLMIRLQA